MGDSDAEGDEEDDCIQRRVVGALDGNENCSGV